MKTIEQLKKEQMYSPPIGSPVRIEMYERFKATAFAMKRIVTNERKYKRLIKVKK